MNPNCREQKLSEIKDLLIKNDSLDLDIILSMLKNEVKNQISSITNNPEKTELEQKIENDLNNFLDFVRNLKTEYWLLRPLNWENKIKGLWFDLYKTMLSFWIKIDEIKTSDDLYDAWLETNSIDNYLSNYKHWIWKKLFLTDDEINNKKVEDIDNIARPYIDSAIKSIENSQNIAGISKDTRTTLRSEYFEEIHYWNNITVFWLLKLFYKYKIRESKAKYEQIHNPREWMNYENILNELKLAFFEIQRILAITVLHIDREKNQIYQHTNEDIDFIIKKLEEITGNNILQDWLFSIEKPLYHMTDNKKFYWSKTKDWKYYIKDEKWNYIDKSLTEEEIKKIEENLQINDIEINFDTIVIEWRSRNYQKDESSVNVLNICSRMNKSAFSSVDKFLRKKYTTFNQIMDHKGFMFVVNDFNEWKKLLKIMENELWTVETSWNEEPIYMREGWNKNTDSSYNCLKARIKIPYKWKIIKEFFDLLDIYLKDNQDLLRKLKNIVDKNKDIDFSNIENIIEDELKSNLNLRKLFNNLKSKFRKKEYYIEIEIQVFDTENYLKSEIDRTSPANHLYYELRRSLDVFWIYHPIEIYSEQVIKKAWKGIIKNIHEVFEKETKKAV